MITVEELNAQTRRFIADMEAAGAEKIRVDEWQLGKDVRIRLSYAHNEQRIFINVANTHTLEVHINLDAEPESYPSFERMVNRARQAYPQAAKVNWALMSG